MKLKGKVAIITGSSRGIGLATIVGSKLHYRPDDRGGWGI